MTQKDMDNLTIYMNSNGSFIGKSLKNGSPSKLRKMLTPQEEINYAKWFVETQFNRLQGSEFTLNINGKPKYKFVDLDKVEEKAE